MSSPPTARRWRGWTGKAVAGDLIFVLREAAGLAVSPMTWLVLGLALALWLSLARAARPPRHRVVAG